MKLSYLNFIARANIKGNKKNKMIVAVIVLFVLSLTIVTSLSATVVNAVNEYKNDYSARSFQITPDRKEFTESVIKQVSAIEHVEGVFIDDGMHDGGFYITNVSGESELQDRIKNGEEAYLCARSLIGDCRLNVVAGKRLDESPTFSCIIPDKFYPFDFPEGVEDYNGSLDYIDGEKLIGKTLNVTASPYEVCISENVQNAHEVVDLSDLSIKLEVVGVYYDNGYTSGFPDTVFVSNETGKLIQQQAIASYNGKYKKIVDDWVQKPELHDYYVVLDKYENIDFVKDKVDAMGLGFDHFQQLGINPDILTISDILSVISIVLLIVTVVLAIIIIAYITFASVFNRKSEIGLMKAIGYKNPQVFLILYFEQLIRTIKGFIIGTAISAIVIAILNCVNSYSSYTGKIFIISINQYLLFVGIALVFSIIVPLICQIISVRKLAKIQPREAMS